MMSHKQDLNEGGKVDFHSRRSLLWASREVEAIMFHWILVVMLSSVDLPKVSMAT